MLINKGMWDSTGAFAITIGNCCYYVNYFRETTTAEKPPAENHDDKEVVSK